jgi:uncharacterized protein (TIGR02145 family)
MKPLFICVSLLLSVAFTVLTETEPFVLGGKSWNTTASSVRTFSDGTPIEQAQSDEAWKACDAEKKPCWCFAALDSGEPVILYNGYAVIDGRKLAPEGFEIPQKSDWDNMCTELGGDATAGPHLKASGYWGEDSVVERSGSNFSAIPYGARTPSGLFIHSGEMAYFWTASAGPGGTIWGRTLRLGDGNVGRAPFARGYGMPIRFTGTQKTAEHSEQD